MAQGTTVNIGQVSAIWVSATAPTNTKLVWYDTGQSIHRIYEPSTGNWIALNPQAVSNTTIASLTTIAEGSGLAIGKMYYLTDVGSLTIALTTTKIWYVDTHNNYIVNDLNTAIQYYVNSTNLFIDGSTGVWNTNTGRLEFSFTTTTSLDNDNDYLVIRRSNNSVWSWIKSKISNLISSVSGNSITWNSGLYFNFTAQINDIKNISGGIVGYDNYIIDKQNLQQSINNVALDNQRYAQQANAYTDAAVTDIKIYDKKLPSIVTIPSSPSNDPAVGWTLKTIIGQIYGWIDKLKLGNNINVGNNFNPLGVLGEVNANDSVMNAIQKIVYKLKRANTFVMQLSPDWVPQPYIYTIDDVEANDTIDTAFAKIQGRINQLGIITTGRLQSRTNAIDYDGQSSKRTDFDIENGQLQLGNLNSYGGNRIKIDTDGIGIKQSSYNEIALSSGFSYSPHSTFKSNAVTTLFCLNTMDNEGYYGLTTDSVKIGGLSLNPFASVESSLNHIVGKNETMIILSGGGSHTIYLPAVTDSFSNGRIVMIMQGSNASITINARTYGNNRIDKGNGSTDSIQLNTRGSILIFVYFYGEYYQSESDIGYNGLWHAVKLNNPYS